MGYLGAYLGATTITTAAPSAAPLPEPVESPLAADDPQLVDHTAVAISHILEQYKEKTSG